MDNEVPQAGAQQGYWQATKGAHIRQVCTSMDIQILKGHVSRDHVHIMVSEMMKRIKGRTSRKLLDEYKGMKKAFWWKNFSARRYFAETTGNVTDEVIMKYIEEQSKMERDKDEEFKVDEK